MYSVKTEGKNPVKNSVDFSTVRVWTLRTLPTPGREYTHTHTRRRHTVYDDIGPERPLKSVRRIWYSPYTAPPSDVCFSHTWNSRPRLACYKRSIANRSNDGMSMRFFFQFSTRSVRNVENTIAFRADFCTPRHRRHARTIDMSRKKHMGVGNGFYETTQWQRKNNIYRWQVFKTLPLEKDIRSSLWNTYYTSAFFFSVPIDTSNIS